MDDLERRFEQARAKTSALDGQVKSFAVKDRLASVLNVVAQNMFDLSKRLKVERPDAALRLDIDHLTVIRDSPSGKPERLYEIGGGENWVGYHLIALFALHSFFIHSESPVPSLIVIDQPSQIYFPEERPQSPSSGSVTDQLNTDWEAVRRVYKMIFDTVRDLGDRLQVVVLDHAYLEDPPEFQTAVRARWREGHKLI